MARLLEHEAKRLFARYEIPIPRGALWPEVPAAEQGLVAKTQVRAGGRGKRGGILFVKEATTLRPTVEHLLGQSIGGQAVESVYLEERLGIARELYLALVLDRDERRPVLLASRQGGVEVEQVPAAEIVRQPLDPLLGPRPSAVRYVARSFGLEARFDEPLVRLIGALERLYHQEEAELVEINPIVLTDDGRLLAADAKIVLDDRADFRHPSRAEYGPDGAGTHFERQVAELGAVGVELDASEGSEPDLSVPQGRAIAALVSGAGLMMATVDQLDLGGGGVRAAVDLGGTVFRGPEVLGEIVRATLTLAPRVLFVNAFLMTASCEPLARGLAAGLGDQGGRTRVVARLVGRDLEAARAILAGQPVLEDLDQAVRVAIEAAAS